MTDTAAKSRLRSNTLSLFTLQGANYILPLITIPYLVRVLGPGNFGRIALLPSVSFSPGLNQPRLDKQDAR